MTQDPQQVWRDYYPRKRRQKIAEAKVLHSEMACSGVTDETVLALDFLCFGNVEVDVRRLAEQLSEHYTMSVSQRKDNGYWNAEGTTRPYGVDGMNSEQCVQWVGFMCDVASSYGCVFSTWRLTDTVRGLSWTNETMEVDTE